MCALGAVISCCGLLEAVGSYRRLAKVVVDCCGLLWAVRGCWRLSEALGGYWKLLEVVGSPRSLILIVWVGWVDGKAASYHPFET